MRGERVIVAIATLGVVAISVAGCDERNPGYLGAEPSDAAAGGSDNQDDAAAGGNGGGIVGFDGLPPDVLSGPCSPSACTNALGKPPCGQWQCADDTCVVDCENCEDQDSDGYGVGAGCGGPDCDDNNPALGRNARVACYDGAAGTLGKGECRAGVRACSEGAWGPCSGDVSPTAEACNSRDDDCDSATDEDLASFSCGVGACANQVAACTAGVVGECRAKTLAAVKDDCGNGDEDCDGAVDEDCVACVHVVPGGVDGESDGSVAKPFGTIAAAITFASADAARPKLVCVAGGTTCASVGVFHGPDDGPLTMSNGVAVQGNYQSATWKRCAGGSGAIATNTELKINDAAGVLFPSTVKLHTVLDGFKITRADTDTSAGVTVDGGKNAVLSNLYIADKLGKTRLYGVNVINGGEAAVVRSSIWAGRATAEVVGVRAAGAKVVLQDNCRGYDAQGRCKELCADGASLGVRGHTPINPYPVESYAVLFEDAPGSQVTLSALCGASGKQGAGLRVRGDGRGVVVRGNVIAAYLGVEDSHGVWAENCEGGAPWIVDNAAISSQGRNDTTRVSAVRAGGDCHPVIDGNLIITGGAEGGAANTMGVHCFAQGGMPSRCVVQGNRSITGATFGASPVGIGVRCDDGACARLSGNRILGGNAANTAGLWLARSGPLVDNNDIAGGCGVTTAAGVSAQQAYARLINNRITGSSCAGNGVASKDNAGLAVAIGDSLAELDVNGNVIDGGNGRANCTSFAMRLDQGSGTPAGPSGIYRNNIMLPGSCPTAAGVREQHASADPRVFENNDLVPGASTAVPIYFDENSKALSLAEVNALAGAGKNLSVDPKFVAYPTNLRLDPASMCIDAGTPAGAPATDADGRARDGKPDIGAYEK